MQNVLVLFLVSSLFLSVSARADFYWGSFGKLYKVESPYSPAGNNQVMSEAAKALFFKIESKTNKKNGVTSFKESDHEVSLAQLILHKSPRKPKMTVGEGCSQNPRQWLTQATELGSLSKVDSNIYIQVPDHLIPNSKEKLIGPDCQEGEHQQMKVFLQTESQSYQYLICADDLNYHLRVSVKESKAAKSQWVQQAQLTLTENCP